MPGVGTNLYDHPSINMRFHVKKSADSLQFLGVKPEAGLSLDLLKSVKELLRWKYTGKGPLTCNVRGCFFLWMSY